ncbi:MAG: GNAT family N-acetyltransferase [Rubrobacteraceae bacterium]
MGSVSGAGLREPLNLLERSLRDGEPLPNSFVSRLKTSIDSGDTEILAARSEGRTIGVLVLYYRLNVSLGGSFASIEDLYVEPEARRRGVGRALLEKAAKRCSERGISYVEAQVEEGEARKFYAGLGFEEEAHVRVFSRSYFLAET